jgi:predicted DsbA family dithiol-disulfide isomerase
MALEVLMYADYICPWCYIATVRLLSATQPYGEALKIKWKSFPIIFENLSGRPITEHGREDRRKAAAQEPKAEFMEWKPPERPYVATSMRALEAAKCAAAQNDRDSPYHWALYRAFFAEARDISDPAVLVGLAGQCGLDICRFANDFVSGAGKPGVMADFTEAVEFWGILTSGVPLVIIGGIPLVGAVPEDSYTKIIDHALALQRTARMLHS